MHAHTVTRPEGIPAALRAASLPPDHGACVRACVRACVPVCLTAVRDVAITACSPRLVAAMTRAAMTAGEYALATTILASPACALGIDGVAARSDALYATASELASKVDVSGVPRVTPKEGALIVRRAWIQTLRRARR